MGIKVANNAFGTLAASISNSATSLTLTTGQGARFPTLGAGDYFYATLIDTTNNLEIVKCTARSSDVLTIVRAQENTTARAYSAGDRVEIRITAATFEEATGLADGEVTTAKLADDAVTADKIGLISGNVFFGDVAVGAKIGIQGLMGTNDFWSIAGYNSDTNIGILEIATGDDGTEEIWVTQYTGGTPLASQLNGSSTVSTVGTRARTVKLLDVNGNTYFPKAITADSGTHTLRRSAASGAQGTHSYATVVVEAGGSGTSNSNYLQFKQSADGGGFQGVLFSDNNLGGYIVHGNAGSGSTDGMYIGGYGHMYLGVGTQDTTTSFTEKDRRIMLSSTYDWIGYSGMSVALGQNKSGTFVRYNDDLWFSDPQNGQINLRNINDTGWGTLTGVFNNQSSRAYKHNITELTSAQEAKVASDLLATPTYQYNYTNEDQTYFKKHIGPMAEEVPLYMNGSETKDSLTSGDVDGALLAALRHALRTIATLEQRVAALENK